MEDDFESQCATMFEQVLCGEVTQDEFADWVERQCVAAVLDRFLIAGQTDGKLLN